MANAMATLFVTINITTRGDRDCSQTPTAS
jgi:hypothetical protein